MSEYSKELPITTQGTYNVVLARWTATFNIETNNLYGQTITIIKNSVVIGTTTFSSLGTAIYEVHEPGVYICECEDYSAEIDARTEDEYDVFLGGLNIRAWLSAGNVTGTYADFSELEADEAAIRQLMTIHNSIDYIATAKAEDSLMEQIINSDVCAKWINLRDYALDTLLANTNIKSVMDEADKYNYGEWCLNGMVPIETSTYSKYGEYIGDTYSTSYPIWYAFNDNPNNFYRFMDTSGDNIHYIGHSFPQKIKIESIKIKGGEFAPVSLQLQASDDNIKYTNIGDIIEYPNTSEYQTYYFNIDKKYEYYRLAIHGRKNPQNNYYYIDISYLQFFEYGPKGNVPEMTSLTTPYGTAFSDSQYNNSYAAWYGFSKKEDHGWSPSTSATYGNTYFGYIFKNPVNVRMVMIDTGANSSIRLKTYKLQGSNNTTTGKDGTWDDIGDIIDRGDSTDHVITYDKINNDNYYKAYRILCLSGIAISTTGLTVKAQFYGREIDTSTSVPTMTGQYTPYGEILYSNYYPYSESGMDFSLYTPFDKKNSTYFLFNASSSSTNEYVGYKFPTKMICKLVTISYGGIVNINFKIQALNDDNEWEDLTDNITTKEAMIWLNNNTAYIAYRMFINWISWSGGKSVGTPTELNFLGYTDPGDYDWDTTHPRKYIYDHGVELETLTSDNFSFTSNYENKEVIKYDSEIDLYSYNPSYSTGIVTENTIDCNDYNKMYIIPNGRPSSTTTDTTNGSLFVGISTTKENVKNVYTSQLKINQPFNNKYDLDISSIVDAEWIWASTYYGGRAKINEWWLE